MTTLQKIMKPLLMAVIATVCLNFTSVAQNMVTNPGFENWDGGKPVDWFGAKTSLAAANVVQYTTSAHTGASACQLIETSSSHKRFTTKPLTVVKGTTYQIKFWVRGQGDIRTGLFDERATGSGYATYSDYISVNSTSWTQYTHEIEADNNCSIAEFIFSVRNTNADKDHIQIDDVEITGGGVVPTELKADFKADKTLAAVGSTIQFTDLSTGDPLVWEWTITGPETLTANVQNPSFKFNKAGSYDVKLVVTNDEESDTEIKADYINIGDFIFYQDWDDKDWKGWTEVSIKGEQKWGWSDKYGIDGSPCVRMSGYDTNSVENEDWLISPEFALNAGNNAVFGFYNARSAHDGPLLEAYFSNNYTGNVEAATWTKLNCVLATNYTYVHSGNISLSSYSGTKCHVAFKYTSTNSASCIWELDNIELKSSSVAIQDIEKQEVKIYPNPTSGKLQVTSYELQIEKMEIFDLLGKSVHLSTSLVHSSTLDISHLSTGVYFLQITLENGTMTTQKVIVK